jgi:DNA polymerase-3 subunit chi
MTIDFYILKTSEMQSLHFACQLIEKHYQQKQKVYVHLNSSDDAKRLDDLLWTYREDSFIPHQLYEENDDFSPPIQLGFVGMPKSFHQYDLLFNLSNEMPDFYNDFTHIIEIVFSDQHVKQLARIRYKHYREQGHEINTIKE